MSAGLISGSQAFVCLQMLTLLSAPPARAQASGALAPQAVADIARGITVRIEGATQGSGVLVERQGDQYTVLTAWHVVSGQRPGEELAIYTPDGREQAVLAGSLQRIGAVDLALLRFRSPNSYALAQRGALSSAAMGSTVYVAGFPLPSSAVPKRLLRFLESRVVADAGADIPNGYQLLYDSRTLTQRGMSGGAVLNSRGQLVATHGRSETDTAPSHEADVAVKTGTSQGVPVAFWREPGGAPQPTESARQPERESPQGSERLGEIPAQRERGQSLQTNPDQGIQEQQPAANAEQIEPNTKPSPTDNEARRAQDHITTGRIKADRGDYRGAIWNYSTALSIESRNTRALLWRAWAKIAIDAPHEAISDTTQALTFDPLNAMAHYIRAIARTEAGETAADAKTSRQRLISIPISKASETLVNNNVAISNIT